jgi:hypothetical protein
VLQGNRDRKSEVGKSWQKKCGIKSAVRKSRQEKCGRKTVVEKVRQKNRGRKITAVERYKKKKVWFSYV